MSPNVKAECCTNAISAEIRKIELLQVYLFVQQHLPVKRFLRVMFVDARSHNLGPYTAVEMSVADSSKGNTGKSIANQALADYVPKFCARLVLIAVVWTTFWVTCQ